MNTAFLSPLIILCLLPFDKGDDLKYEQIAVDSFFEKIYEKKFSGYKVLEFSGQTASRTKEYLGLIYRCEKLDDSLKEKIFEAAPTLNRKIIINYSSIKIKKVRSNSNRLKFEVHPSITIEKRHYVLITLYRKLRFVEYYFLELDNEGELISYCNTGEII